MNIEEIKRKFVVIIITTIFEIALNNIFRFTIIRNKEPQLLQV